MVIYEVNIEIEKEIYSDYYIWLIDHIREMLGFPGFSKALLMEENQIDNSKICVHYQIESSEDLDSYLNNHAQKMRGSIPTLFQGKFSITRRILKISQQFSRNQAK